MTLILEKFWELRKFRKTSYMLILHNIPEIILYILLPLQKFKLNLRAVQKIRNSNKGKDGGGAGLEAALRGASSAL